MNKKNITIILIGTFFIIARFWITLGPVKFDIANDILGYVLILIGLLPMRSRNSRFKKSFIMAIAGIAVAVISQGLMFFSWGDAESSMESIAIGITVVFAIYFSYYFNESLILESKVQEKQAVTRNYRLSWSLMGLALFIQYIAFKPSSVPAIILGAVASILAIYYCYTVSVSSRQLCED